MCKSSGAISEYLYGKTLVVFATQSYVPSEESEPVSYLVPIVEKRLDSSLAKSVNAVVQEFRVDT